MITAIRLKQGQVLLVLEEAVSGGGVVVVLVLVVNPNLKIGLSLYGTEINKINYE